MLLELDESQHSERTVFIPPPEPDPNHPPILYKTFQLDSKLMRPQKNFHLRNIALNTFGIAPGSPMARRTKHEIKVAQRMARKQVRRQKYSIIFILFFCFFVIILDEISRQLSQNVGDAVYLTHVIVYGFYTCQPCCRCPVSQQIYCIKLTKCL